MTSAREGVHVHDYHAGILRLMGIGAANLPDRYAGGDFRLTDVNGAVIRSAPA